MEKSPIRPPEIPPHSTEHTSDISDGVYSEEFGRNIVVVPIEGGEVVVDAATDEELNFYYDGDGEEGL